MDALDRYVEEIRRSKGEGVPIPGFSPNDGRTEAQVLFLLRDPGNSGASQSGVVDRDNPGWTARNFRVANENAGLDRKLTVSWNAVPWPVGKGKGEFDAALGRVRAKGWLNKLLDPEVLPRLRVVVLLGKDAQKVADDVRNARRALTVLHGPHPNWCQVYPDRWERLERAVITARDLVAAE